MTRRRAICCWRRQAALVKRIERSLLSHSRRDAYSIINLRADDELIAAFPA